MIENGYRLVTDVEDPVAPRANRDTITKTAADLLTPVHVTMIDDAPGEIDRAIIMMLYEGGSGSGNWRVKMGRSEI